MYRGIRRAGIKRKRNALKKHTPVKRVKQAIKPLKAKSNKQHSDTTLTNANRFSRMSNMAYDTLKDRNNSIKNHNLHEEYEYVQKHSDKYNAVFKHKTSNHIVVASRGTELKKGFGDAIKDVGSDLLIATGLQKLGTRYRGLSKKIDRLQNIYKDHDVILTGHSLGGRLASDVAKAKGLEAHVFNPGSSPIEAAAAMRQIKLDKPMKHAVHTYHAKGDSISMSEKLNSVAKREGIDQHYKFQNKGKGVFSAHSLENFFY